MPTARFAPALLASLASVAALQTASQVHVYVDDDAPPGGDGLSWQAALDDLGAAIALSDALGSERGEIRVAAGWYRAAFESGFAVPTYVEEQGPGLMILGGFAGLSDPQSPDARDPDAFATVLSRQGVDQGAVFEVQSAMALGACGAPGITSACVLSERTLFSGLRFIEDQAISVRTINTARPNIEVESCRFEGCHAFQGGAIAFDYGKLVVTSSVFKDNTAERDGGAVYAPGFDDEVAEFESCVFEGNTVLSGDGGAIDGAARAADCDFIGNTAGSDGGAVASPDFVAQTSEFIGCWFEGNAAGDNGGALEAWDATVRDCTFVENIAADNGGAVTLVGSVESSSFLMNTAGRDGGAIHSTGTVSDSTIEGNHADRNGGGMNNVQFVQECAISGNTAGDESGGAHNVRRIIGTLIEGNTAAAVPGGGRFFDLVQDCEIRGNAPWGLEDVVEARTSLFEGNDGVAVHLVDDRGSLSDSTVLSSSSGSAVHLGESSLVERCFIAAGPTSNANTLRFARGGAEIIDSVLVGETRLDGFSTTALLSGCTLVNPADRNTNAFAATGSTVSAILESCVLQNNQGFAVRASGGQITLVQCLVRFGEDDLLDNDGGLIAVLGDLVALDPLFADPAGPDGDPLTYADNDYRPTAGSPVIDRGSDIGLSPAARNVDIDGAPRSWDDTGIVNEGLFPNNPIDIGAYEFQGTTCLADVNLDGSLTPADFGAWILAYGQGSLRADMNRNGVVEPSDYTLWIVLYQIGC